MSGLRTPTLSLRLDTRRAKKDGTYPVKLEVYFNYKQRWYNTSFSLSRDGFEKAWLRRKPQRVFRSTRDELDAIMFKAREVIDSLPSFTFDAFEGQFFGTLKAQGHDVISLFEKKTNNLRAQDRHGSADAYTTAMRAFQGYLEKRKKAKAKTLSFEDVTPEFLEDFEQWMTNQQGKSLSTVGVYARHLRAIFNEALEEGITSNYPFGKKKYRIPTTRKAKKALNLDELRTLTQANPGTEYQGVAKDFFLLSYFLYGINIKDLAKLKNGDLDGKFISFYRSKTITTSKQNLKAIKKQVPSKAWPLIYKYQSTSSDPKDYLFNIIHQDDGVKAQRHKIQRFTRFVNQHLKRLAREHELPSEISYQWARHTFATLYVQSGGRIEEVSEALGHSDLKVTYSYFQGFEEDQGIDIMESITNL